MAEAIAALSLACNILQRISTCNTAVKIYKELHQRGTLENDPGSLQIASLCSILEIDISNTSGILQSSHSQQSNSPTTPQSQPANVAKRGSELFSCAKKCQEVGTAIAEEINYISNG